MKLTNLLRHLTRVGMLASTLCLIPTLPAGAAVQELCLRYPVETVDSGLGVDYEDYYAENDAVWPYWKARGAAYQLLNPNNLNLLIQQGYASNDNGCFTVDESLLPPSKNVVLVFYLDSLIHDNIRVRTRIGNAANCNDNPFADHTGEPSFCQPLVCAGETGPLVGPGKKYFDFFCNMPEVTIQALAAFPVYWWHHFDLGALDYDFTITARHRDGCPNPATASCSNAGYYTDGDDLEILVNIDDQTERKYRQKFLMGHEIGHALEEAYQTARFGTMTYLSGSYGLAADPACGSGTEAHALTSREYTSAAIMEGFAHFISADSYNNHNQSSGRFTYYKDDLGFPRDIALEGQSAFNMGNPHQSNRYFERVCTATASNAGTELDWMRFFWDLHTVGGGADGEHENLFQLRVDAAFQGGPPWGSQNGYHLLQANACDGPAGAQMFQADFLTYAGSDDAVGGNGIEPDGMVPACP